MKKHVVIVGGGVVGLCCAYHAVRRGWSVSLVDEGSGRTGCSFGNAGLVVPSHFVPLAAPGVIGQAMGWLGDPAAPFGLSLRASPGQWKWLWRFWRSANKRQVEAAEPVLRDLGMASRALYDAMAREHGNPFGLREKGLVVLCRSEEGLCEEVKVAEQGRALGIPVSVLDRHQVKALMEGTEVEVRGGVYFPKDCHLVPERLMGWLQDWLADQGVLFQYGERVLGWRMAGPEITAVRTGNGDVEGDEFVLAAGMGTRELAAKAGARLPMQGGKGYSVTIKAPAQAPLIPCLLKEARVAVTPMGGVLRVGGTMEIGSRPDEVAMRRVGGMVRSVPGYFPAIRETDLIGQPVWAGVRPMGPDGLPYLGRTRVVSNLLVAAGHAMLGVSLGPVTGDWIGRLLDGEELPGGAKILSPDRFA